MKTLDALVIGAGPAGATAALLLARAGWSVAVAEKVAFPRRKVCGEYVSATTWPLLRELGVAEALEPFAGPPVDRVGLFAGETVIDAPMPRMHAQGAAWGRAVEREQLDAALLERAAHRGARVCQPVAVRRLTGSPGDFTAETDDAPQHARVVIAAHGSWEHGELPTQMPRRTARPSDLFGFKAHFTGASLDRRLMPLVLFPGGYGGMVQTGRDRTSFSCCIRRDALAHCRARHPRDSAGEAVIAHVRDACRGVRESLDGATLVDAWLAAGPIRPGIRPRAAAGIYTIGNAAGEAHPLVAEGISMAMQSAWLLCDALLRSRAAEARVRAAKWRRQRAGYSAAFAALTTSTPTAAVSAAVLRHVPAILTWGARCSSSRKRSVVVMANPCATRAPCRSSARPR